MGIKVRKNPFTGELEYFNENGRKVGLARPNPIMGGYMIYDGNGNRIGDSYEDPITLISTYYDRKGNKRGYSFENEFMGSTEYYDRDFEKKGTVYHNPFSYEEDYIEEKRESGSSSYGAPHLSFHFGEIEEPEPVFQSPNITFSPIEEEPEETQERHEAYLSEETKKMLSEGPSFLGHEDMFAAYAAALLKRNGVPYDGSYYELSATKTLRNGEWGIVYRDDFRLEESMDSYYLLGDETEVDDGAADIGLIDTNHYMTVLFGNGTVYRGKYKCRETRRNYSERLIDWDRQRVSDHVDLIEDYLRKSGIQVSFDSYLQMMGQRR